MAAAGDGPERLTGSARSPWLPQPPRGTGLTLFCFPWAGAGAGAFSRWREHASSEGSLEVVPVQLPGRERRIAEPPPTTLEALVENLVPELVPHCGRGFALYGHSAGALIGFAVGAALQRLGLMPTTLVVSGSRPPHVSDERPPMHGLSDARLLDRVVELGATPRALLDDRELLALVLPTLRADLRLAETYAVTAPLQLACPVTAIAALEDDVAVETVARWRETTSGEFELVTIAGGHFAAVESDEGGSPPALQVARRAAAASAGR